MTDTQCVLGHIGSAFPTVTFTFRQTQLQALVKHVVLRIAGNEGQSQGSRFCGSTLEAQKALPTNVLLTMSGALWKLMVRKVSLLSVRGDSWD